MKKSREKVERYEDGDYYIDIIKKGDKEEILLEGWISSTYYNESMLMFGLCNMKKNEFIKIVESNLEEYKRLYVKKFEEDIPF